MKQHITPEQLNELSDKAYDRLLRHLLTKNYPREELVWYQVNGKGRRGTNLHEILPTIGQMIEFLTDAGRISWAVPAQYASEVVSLAFTSHHELSVPVEFADVLWEACKEVLNASN